MKRNLNIFLLLFLLLLCLPATIAAAFSDVKSSDWFAADVGDMTAEGLICGYPDGTFRPGRTITAAEFVSIVGRCGGLEPAASSSSHWAAGTMQAALEAGWYDWDELPPTGEKYDLPLPRQLAVNILMRALLPDKTGDYVTESAKMADFSALDGRYYNKVLAAYSCGVVAGDDQGRFNPKSGLTRAEACTIIRRAQVLSGQETPALPDTPAVSPAPTPTVKTGGGVSEHGKLHVQGTQLCDEHGAAVELHGMSSHGIQWFPQYTTKQAIANTAAYGANLFRVAMYTGEGGYLSSPAQIKKAAYAAMDAAIENDMYVIIDWHILSDGDPLTHLKEAQAFFQEVSAQYADSPAVLYEICNEPNGGVTWKNNIKPYAQALVKTIRSNAPDSIILIGSGTWSQDLQDPAADPVVGTNLMYTCHFYAGTHGAWLRQRIADAQKRGLAVFVSEWGASRADGSGSVFTQESETWLNFLHQNGISWSSWSLCDKNETSAALKPGTPTNRPWTDNDLTPSGKFVFSHF